MSRHQFGANPSSPHTTNYRSYSKPAGGPPTAPRPNPPPSNGYYQEKGELEALFFAIQTKRKAMGRRAYAPPHGLFIHDVEAAWARLDHAENERQHALILELQRQERLELQAQIFFRKTAMREQWLTDIENVLANVEIAATAPSVEAAAKMIETINTEAAPKADRFRLLPQMSHDLQAANYHSAEAVRRKEREVIQRWTRFQAMLGEKKAHLDRLTQLTVLIRDMDTLSAQLGQLELHAVTQQHAQLVDLCHERQKALQRAKEYFQFLDNLEDEINWVSEKIHFCRSTLEADITSHWQRNKEIADRSRRVLSAAPSNRDEGATKMQTLKVRWDQLREEADKLAKWLSEAEQASQYFQEANDAESWIKEKIPLAKSTDHGHDLRAAQSLTKRHGYLENDINGYRNEISRLDEAAERLVKSKFFAADSEGTSAALEAAEVEESMVPRVRVLYAYEGNGISVAKGEVLALLDRTNDDWWRILKQDGVEGYAPANYCHVIPNETVTVSHRPPKSQKKAAVEGAEALLQRQEAINGEYRRLVALAQARRRLLADAVQMFRFVNECQDFENWAKETQALIAENTPADHIAAFRQKFDKLENDVANSGGTQLKQINDMADELISEGHSKTETIRARQQRVNQIWHDLQKLLKHKAENLAAAERLSEFNDNCDDTRSWMREKFDLLNRQPESGDLRALQALQRHYQNLKRDLVPLKERMNHLRELGAEIKRRHPEHAAETDRVLAELGKMHADLEREARLRIDAAEQSQGRQLFERSAAQLLEWCAQQKKAMLEEPVGGEPAEDLVKRHADRRDKIAAHSYEFTYTAELGESLLRKNPRLADVANTLQQIEAARADLEAAWKQRDAEYRQLLELQVFNREAERIDALTKGQERECEIGNLGDSVEGVENLLKRHADFDQKLHAQEERVKAFCETADALIHSGHAHSNFIARRRDEVLDRRRRLYAASQQRRARLDDALVYQQLRRDAAELDGWMADKRRIAVDDSFKNDDAAALDRRLLKHEAFVAELKANDARLHVVCADGQALIAQQHFESPQIVELVQHLEADWVQLSRLVDEKSHKLAEADEKKTFDRQLHDTHAKLDDIEGQLASEEPGADLRSVKQLLQRQSAVDEEIRQLEQRVKDILALAERMIAAGHYDAPQIQRAVDHLVDRFNRLREPLDRRQEVLEESLKWHQLAFDADVELQWIAEKRHVVAAGDSARSLTEATNARKKHDQLEAEVAAHQPRVTATLRTGDALVAAKHMAATAIRRKCDELDAAWRALNGGVVKRRALLDWALRRERFFADSAEVEAWIIVSKTQKVDQFSAERVLGWLKSLRNDMQMYRGKLDEQRATADEVAQSEPNGRQEAAASPVLQRQGHVEAAFDALEQLADEKQAEMENFMTLCQYNHESRELEEWINDQLQVAMSEEYGQDYEHLQDLKSKFEEFRQNVRTGSERSVLCEQVANDLLQRGTPFARDVLRRQEKLRTAWSLLLEYIDSRAHKLDAAANLHRFNQQCADLHEKLTEKRVTLPVEFGRSVKEVSNLILKHQTFARELEQMHHELEQLLSEGANLKLEYPGPNAEHIDSQLAALSQSYHQLNDAATNRFNKLQAAYDLQIFYTMARDFVAWNEQALAEMQDDRPPEDLQTAEWTQAEHQRLQAEIQTRDVENHKIQQAARGMVEQRHYASKEIEKRADEVESVYARTKKEWKLRNVYLTQVVQWHGFQREAQQILAAIRTKDETLKTSRTMSSVEEVESQMRQFDTFGKALGQLDSRVQDLDDLAKRLTDEKHMQIADINEIDARVQDAQRRLHERMDLVRRELEDALRVARFDDSVQELSVWLDEQLALLRAQSADTTPRPMSVEEKLAQLKGRQALEIQLSANAPRVEAIGDQLAAFQHQQRGGGASVLPEMHVNRLGSALIAHGGENKAEVQHRLKEMNDAWALLQGRIEKYQETLKAALEVHRFNGDVDETNGRIHEKATALQSDDFGRELREVEELIRKQEKIERDMSAIHSKLNEHDDSAKVLLAKEPPLSESIILSLKKLEASWQQLAELAHTRRLKLQQSFNLHRYFDSVKKMEQWAQQIRTKMVSYVRPRSVEDARQLLSEHAERQAEIESRQAELSALREFGQQVTTEQPDHRAEIQRAHRRLQNIEHQIRQTWEQENSALQKALELQTLYAQVLQTESWLATKEAFVNEYDLGDSVDGVDLLIRKHENFEKTLKAQSDKMDALRAGVHILDEAQEPDVEKIRQKYENVVERYEKLLESCEVKRRRLEDSRKLHEFIRSCSELITWMNAKLQLAYDDAYIDPTNLRSKLRKHLAFDAELQQSEHRVEAVKAEGEKLLNETQYENDRVQAQLHEVIEGWQELRSKSAHKTRLLQESYEAHQLSSKVAELDKWLDRVEHDLGTEDHGVDVQSAEKLIKKHDQLRSEIDAKAPVFQEVVDKAAHLKSLNYENIEEQLERTEALRQRYASLAEPCAIRAENLAESLRFFGWAADADEQLVWLADKLPQLRAREFGNSLHAAQSLQKKHQILQQEVDARRSIVAEIRERGEQMRHANHFNAAEIAAKLRDLDDQFALLEELNAERTRRLAESLRSQQFYAEAAEAESWCRERLPLVANQDTGANQSAADAHLRRVAALEAELQKFEGEVHRLHDIAHAMIDKGHFDQTTLTTRQANLEHLFEDLQIKWQRRRAQLLDASRYYNFVRQVNDLTTWLSEKERLALCDDYGADLEECRALIEEFELAIRELSASGERLHSVVNYAKREQLLREGHPYEASIYNAVREIEDLWRRDILEAAIKFADRLDQAKNKQAYFQEWRDLVTWIQHMRTTITGEILPRDLANCEALNVRHAEYHTEIRQREPQKNAFVAEGRKMIHAGNALSQEINTRVDQLEEGFAQLHARQRVYEENYDAQKWLHNAALLEKWLAERETHLTEDWRQNESVEQVEDAIRQYEDFLATLDAQAPQFEALRRMTKVEESWARMRANEDPHAYASRPVSRRESSIGGENRRDTQQIKVIEKKKILQEKRQERERRKTQEITVLKRSPSQENTTVLASSITSATLPRARNRTESIEPQVIAGTSSEVELSQSTHELGRGGQVLHVKTQQTHTVVGVSAQLSAGSSKSGGDAERPTSIVGGLFSGRARGFNTRRTQSIKKMKQWDELKSIDMNGYVDRKHELSVGGRKATNRSWRNHYTILCGQLLCFFKDEDSFFENNANAPPVYILHARCVVYPEYAKRKHTFKLNTHDGQEFLFSCETYAKMIEWVEKINFHARLDPSHQLTSFNKTTNSP
ncbi:Spectrin repeat-containing domain protein [Aphelenchoides fujianensis]|nr:Spectrin repeat-containing domain protein [Aphelenchoides fujianensis]